MKYFIFAVVLFLFGCSPKFQVNDCVNWDPKNKSPIDIAYNSMFKYSKITGISHNDKTYIYSLYATPSFLNIVLKKQEMSIKWMDRTHVKVSCD